ncbi:MAG: hypothetical protein K8W52_13840 [Deltaproteobacteria bacterium]|nr:hypothetical protein [Deltaproteobacteria bacterium]
MKLYGTIAVHVRGEDILRQPGWTERIRKAFGGAPDLRTGRMRASLEATALVDAIRTALRTLAVDDAVSLVVDDLVVFQDHERTPNDLGDLFLAFHEYSSAIGGGFDILRLAVEHTEAGVHHVVEVQAHTEHAIGEPAVRIIVSSRIAAFAPVAGESAEAYRARVEPLAKDTATVEVGRLAFDSFVTRVRDAVQRALPEARAEVVRSDLRVVKPGADGRVRDERAVPPDDPHYDPHAAYYPNPMANALNMMMWGALAGAMFMPGMPSVTVVNETNAPTEEPGAGEGDAGGADAGGDAGGDADAGGWADAPAGGEVDASFGDFTEW